MVPRPCPTRGERIPLAQERPRGLRQSDPALIYSDDELVSRQLTHARALVACSRELMTAYGAEDANRAVLSRALDHLRAAVGADRADLRVDPAQPPAPLTRA